MSSQISDLRFINHRRPKLKDERRKERVKNLAERRRMRQQPAAMLESELKEGAGQREGEALTI